MHKTIRFGIIGYGKMGKIRAHSINQSKNATLVSIYDITKFKLDVKNIKVCQSFDELNETCYQGRKRVRKSSEIWF